MVPLSEDDDMMAMSIEFVRRLVPNKLHDKETFRARQYGLEELRVAASI